MQNIILGETYIINNEKEVVVISRVDDTNVFRVKNCNNNAEWYVLSDRLKLRLMKAMPINDMLLESLPNGRYAIFIDGQLYEVILIENYDKNKILYSNVMPVVGCIGKDEIFTASEYISGLPVNKSATIILADQITINSL